MAGISAANAGTVSLGDLTVNRLGFGAMRITGDGIWGEPKDHDSAIAVLKRAVELDVNFIDTADAYGPEVSENLIAEALSPYQAGLVIATKGGLLRGGPGDWRPDGRPEHLREACEQSLKRLAVDHIDVYQFHRPDPDVPYTDSIQALVDLQKEGKIRHIGVSNVSVEQLQQALDMTPIVSVQNNYNILNREHEAVLKLCEEKSIAFIPYFPIGGNVGGVSEAALEEIAGRHQATLRQIALAWLLAHSPVMLPIPGTGSVEHLEENVAAASIKLTDEDLQAIGSMTTNL
jgi:pyridoxine 4-dehydrogenase